MTSFLFLINVRSTQSNKAVEAMNHAALISTLKFNANQQMTTQSLHTGNHTTICCIFMSDVSTKVSSFFIQKRTNTDREDTTALAPSKNKA